MRMRSDWRIVKIYVEEPHLPDSRPDTLATDQWEPGTRTIA